MQATISLPLPVSLATLSAWQDTLSSTHLHLCISDGFRCLSASSSLFSDLSDRVSRSSSHLHQMHRALLPWIEIRDLLLGTGVIHVIQHQMCPRQSGLSPGIGSQGLLPQVPSVSSSLWQVGAGGNCGKCHIPVVVNATIRVSDRKPDPKRAHSAEASTTTAELPRVRPPVLVKTQGIWGHKHLLKFSLLTKNS